MPFPEKVSQKCYPLRKINGAARRNRFSPICEESYTGCHVTVSMKGCWVTLVTISVWRLSVGLDSCSLYETGQVREEQSNKSEKADPKAALRSSDQVEHSSWCTARLADKKEMWENPKHVDKEDKVLFMLDNLITQHIHSHTNVSLERQSTSHGRKKTGSNCFLKWLISIWLLTGTNHTHFWRATPTNDPI